MAGAFRRALDVGMGQAPGPPVVPVHHEEVKRRAIGYIDKLDQQMAGIPGNNDVEIAELERLSAQKKHIQTLLYGSEAKHEDLAIKKQKALGEETGTDLERQLREKAGGYAQPPTMTR